MEWGKRVTSDWMLDSSWISTDEAAASQVGPESIISNMTQEAHELLQKALALPENERAELAGSLIASLDASVDQDVDAAWQQEVVHRLHDVQSGKVKTI